MDWLTADKSGLAVDPESISFIKTPTDYYDSLLNGIRTAKHRIILSSLYLGTGELEIKLVQALENAIEANPNLEVGILLDYLRGTRGAPTKSSSTMLASIADKANVSFYHTPDLRGFTKSSLPARMNEIVGLQHMKFYVFDDDVIISGANLSDSYFVDRQDRYVMIKDNKSLVSFFDSVFKAVSGSSFRLKGDGKLELPNECTVHPYEGDRQAFTDDLAAKLRAIAPIPSALPDSKTSDTLVYPFIQYGPVGINDEVDLLTRLFGRAQPDLAVTVATGYFNPHDRYLDQLLNQATYPASFVFAAPDANGFYNGEGLSGYIPHLYVNLSKDLYEAAKAKQRDLTLHEYSRPGWTFHGKGIWIEQKTAGISATMLGSSNYGYRSASRDMEAQVLVVTSNDKLRARLEEERKALLEFTSIVDAATFRRPDHCVPYWVKLFSRAFKHFF
uniref:CDP-diacylglycerol--glycerol-3-phosphate 3-phosphatidyltransferase n=1 Tax=Panagrellus redivivus TaxID=6233 RepID=A0A7E4V5L4_PANRE